MKALPNWALGLLIVFCTSAVGQTISASSYIVTTLDGEVLLEKNADAVRPIASITKLFVAEQAQLLDPLEQLTITEEDVREGRMRFSPLKAGSQYTRAELIELALVSSDNIAAKALGRTTPPHSELAQLVEPSGLNPENKSSARNLAVVAAELYRSAIGEISVLPTTSFGKRRNTNPLLQRAGWRFFLSKTGFIRQAGGCLVAVVEMKNTPTVVVILGSRDTRQRWRDLATIRKELGDTGFFVPALDSQKKARRT
jgi:D-alanyl-D-alanine endopeptidase (penicillin-binding protein 7)